MNMSVVMVSEVVKAFSPAFNSVDLRIVAVKPEDRWINVITSIRLSTKSREEINSEQEEARDKLPRTDKFRIFLDSCDIKQLRILFEAFNEEEIKVSNTLIKFRGLDLFTLRVDRYLPDYLKEMEEWKLVGSQEMGREEDRRNLWPIVESQNGTAKLLGFEDIYELISETLKIRDFSRDRRRDLIIGIPLPARIADASLVGSSVKIKTKKVVGLEDLQLNLCIRRVKPRAYQYDLVWRKTELVKKCKRAPARNFCYVTNFVELTNLRPHDRIEVELIHRQVPTISMDEVHLEAPLENAVEPFAKALNSFCSLETFKKRVLNPERCKEGKAKPQDIFENAVAWLLSLVGFSVLHIGKYFENLKIPETDVQIGSADILAYRENECILLVDCTTSLPDDDKIRSMIAVKEHFRFIQDEHRQPNIISVIFSPKDCSGISVDRQVVKIVGRYQIKQMFEEAMKGNPEKARSSLVY
jgi:hypothetical protein